MHDHRESNSTREVYIMDIAKYGIRKNRDRVLVRLDEVVTLSTEGRRHRLLGRTNLKVLPLRQPLLSMLKAYLKLLRYPLAITAVVERHCRKPRSRAVRRAVEPMASRCSPASQACSSTAPA